MRKLLIAAIFFVAMAFMPAQAQKYIKVPSPQRPVWTLYAASLSENPLIYNCYYIMYLGAQYHYTQGQAWVWIGCPKKLSF